MTESPADTLTRAADVLDSAAAEATPGPWEVSLTGLHMDGSWDRVAVQPRHAPSITEKVRREADADWIVLMSPAIAAPLASWLRALASDVSRISGVLWSRGSGRPSWEARAAYEFARAILAGVENDS